MNRWLALAKEPDEKAVRLPDTPTEPDKRGLCRVLSGCRVEKSEMERPRPADPPQPSRDTDNPFRHGRAPGNRPVTWCGQVVSLDEWRRLSAWDRHGPDGRLHCGICKAWVQPDGRCAQPGCWNGEGGAA